MWHLFLGFWWRLAFNLPAVVHSPQITPHTHMVSLVYRNRELEIHLSYRGLENWGKVGKKLGQVGLSDGRMSGVVTTFTTTVRIIIVTRRSTQRNAQRSVCGSTLAARRLPQSRCAVGVPSPSKKFAKAAKVAHMLFNTNFP